MAAKDDAACEAAWAENRRRFFTYPPGASAASTPPADGSLRKSEDQVGDMGGTGVIDNFLGSSPSTSIPASGWSVRTPPARFQSSETRIVT